MSEARMKIGSWQVDAAANRMTGVAGDVELEPRVMDLLILLARRRGTVVSKTEIMKALWGDVHVNDDALTRSVFKLRKALGDDARQPDYIETVSKRGYRLIADVSTIGEDTQSTKPRQSIWPWAGGIGLSIILIAGLFWTTSTVPDAPTAVEIAEDNRLSRADGFYNQFTRTDNEAALRLYESVLEDEPDDAAALAGLANALTQRQVRYMGPGADGEGRGSLMQALESGWLDTDDARAALQRATALAERSTDIDPSHARAWRALGLAKSASRDFAAAERAYERALVINPDDWGTMINLSELSVLMGKPVQSTPYLEQAWYAMERGYDEDPVAIRPWHSEVGLSVARAKAKADAPDEAELWYRRVLGLDPLNADAIRELSGLLSQFGDTVAAEELCQTLARSSDEVC